VTCYMWHEALAGRGSSEIATCMNKYIDGLPNTVKKLMLFSDTCEGQNRKKNFSAICFKAVTSGSLESVEQIFLESGHSQMDCDLFLRRIHKSDYGVIHKSDYGVWTVESIFSDRSK
jgi:hypothetical protein